MRSLFNILKSDYLQRTRSYTFLITLCASLAVAYTFVPAPNANYSTIRIADYVGTYNAAWFGYVTAIMTSVFLSLIGFYLVNNGIKKDMETKVGQIVASTSVSNFNYLLSKVLSNFLVLLTIVGMVFLMSIGLFVLYNDGSPFELMQFIKPYLLITLPAMFFISTLAVIFEVFLGRYSVLQHIGFFFLFSSLMVYSPRNELQFSFDVVGSRIVTHQMEETVKKLYPKEKETGLNIGYVIGSKKNVKKFRFRGIDFPTPFITSRLVIMLLCIALIAVISPFFHRFDVRPVKTKTRAKSKWEKTKAMNSITLTDLPSPQRKYSIVPLVKTEFLMLFRKGKRWLWPINLLGMIGLALLPLEPAHRLALPILWFLQVHRLSDLTTKEMTNNVHYMSYTSFKPVRRVLVSQLFAGILLTLLLASPLLFRLGVAQDYEGLLNIVSGGLFIVVLAALLGIVSKGKKLFEVLFFMITYANINGIAFLDYFGGFEHQKYYMVQMLLLIILLAALVFLMRITQLKKG